MQELVEREVLSSEERLLLFEASVRIASSCNGTGYSEG